ncbi:MAG: tetratricopeptide repeat protein [Cyclobacteriaceae bacterium]
MRVSSNAIELKDFKKANEALKKAWFLASIENDTAQLANILFNKALVSYYTNNDSSVVSFEEASRLFMHLSDSNSISQCFRMIGIINKDFGFSEKAIRAYILSQQYVNTQEEEAGIFTSLGNLYLNLEENEKALSYYQKAINVYEELNIDHFKAFGYNNLGTAHKSLKSYKKATQFYTMSLEIGTNLSDTITISRAQLNLGQLYLDTGNLDSARVLLHRALELRDGKYDQSKMVEILNLLGEVYRKTNQYEASRDYLDRATGILRNVDSRKHSLDNYRFQKHLTSDIGDYRQSLRWDSKYDSLQKIYFEEERLNVTKLQADFDLQQKEAERLSMERESEDQRYLAQVRLWIVIGLSIVFLTVLYLLWSLARNKRRIESLNEKINKQNQVIRVQAKDISHRTSNSLQLLGSLINLQANRVENPDIRVALKDTWGRLEVINQVHSKLLTSHLGKENNTLKEKINLHDYISTVLDGAFATVDSPKYQFDCDNTEVIMDICWTVGLIVQEISTNYIKYVLGKNSGDKLTISIREQDGSLKIETWDNGAGFNVNARRNGSFGLDMINALTEGLNGKLTLQSDEAGTKYKVVIPLEAIKT